LNSSLNFQGGSVLPIPTYIGTIGVIVGCIFRLNTVIVFSVVERIENGNRHFPSVSQYTSHGRTRGKKIGGGGKEMTRLFPIVPDLPEKNFHVNFPKLMSTWGGRGVE
jgi:hypothetical protein